MPNLIQRLRQEKGLTLDMLMTLHQLREGGSIASIAPGDRNRQNTCSRQISSLERFFGGVKLTTKKGREVTLSIAGRDIADQIGEHFRKIQDILDRNSDQGTEFHLGANGTVLEWYVIPRLAKFAKKMPKISFRFSDMKTDEVAQALASEDLDFGVLRSNVGLGKAFSTIEIASHGYRIYGPASCPEKELLKMPLAMASAREFRKEVARFASAKKQVLNVSFECQSHAQSALLVREGVAAAILPDLADRVLRECPSVQPNWLKGYQRKMKLAWRKRSEGGSKHMVAKDVIESLKQRN